MASKFELNDSTPAAPAGRINVTWQSDSSGNVSAHVAETASLAYAGATQTDVLPKRQIVTFQGAGVTLSDDAANKTTIVNIPGATGFVPATRRVIAGTGLTGGGPLSSDVTLNANIAAIQTPWLQDINANGFSLTNARRIVANYPEVTTFACTATFNNSNAAAHVTAGVVRIEAASTALDHGLLVGIGGANTVFNFTAAGDAYVRGPVRVGEVVDPLPSGVTGLALTRPAGNTTSLYFWQQSVASAHVGFKPNDSNLYLVNAFADGTITNGKGISIDVNGRVGIGTAPAFTSLVVSKDATPLSDAATAQIAVTANNTNKRLVIGYDTGGNSGMVQAYEHGGSVQALAINPLGGNVSIGGSQPFNRFSVGGGALGYTEANTGAGIVSIGTGVSQLDSKLLFGVESAAGWQHAWIQSTQPGTSPRPLLLNAVGGPVIMQCAEGGYPGYNVATSPNNTVMMHCTSTVLFFSVKLASGVVKSASLSLT